MKYFKLFENYTENNLWYHGSTRNEIDFEKMSENIDYNMLGFGLYLTSSIEEAKQYVFDKSNEGYVFKINISENSNILDYNSPIPDDIKNTILEDSSFYDSFIDTVIEPDFEDYQYISDEVQLSWDSNDDGYFIYDEIKDDFLFQNLKKEEVIPLVKKEITNSNITKSHIEIDKLLFYTPEDGGTEYLKKDMVFNTMYHLLQYLNIKFDSSRKISEYLVQFGIDGITTNQTTTDIGYEYDALTLVCYNKDIYTIEKITDISK
jgi:hypothetical protein